MASRSDSIQWPSISIPADIKNLISALFSLIESKETTVGDQLANKVFTSDGKFITPHSNATGSAEIAKCRDHVWATVEKRGHQITKVYASDGEGLDLMLLGIINSELKDGSKSTVDFAARLVLQRTTGVKVKLYQASGFSGGRH